MGASGVGKDTVLRGVLRLMGNRAFLAPRVVTRDVTAADEGALPVTEVEFRQMEDAGLLALSWRAHGLAYGILRHMDERLAAGQDVFVNGSRAYLEAARAKYRDLVPVLLHAEPEALRARLVRRGRETEAEIAARMERNSLLQDKADTLAEPVLRIDNSGDPALAIHLLYTQLQQWPRGG
jgi:ribose 1,5-bisphosphokinase